MPPPEACSPKTKETRRPAAQCRRAPGCLDDLLPTFQQREIHTRRYRAQPDQLREALVHLRITDLPLTRVLFTLRRIRLPNNAAAVPILDQLEHAGFCRVVDRPDALAFVAIGRFWRPDGQRIHIDNLDAFRRFDQPGYAKGALSFQFTRENDGSTAVTTETRVAATDTAARLLMSAYWNIIRIGSSLIRREILAALASGANATLSGR